MSDKALIYLHSPRDKQLSCGLYLHADGWQVKEILAWALRFMRHGDTHFDFAKLVWATGNKIGAASLGRTYCVYPPPKGGGSYAEQLAYLRTAREWPGDAGVFLVDVDSWQCEYVGGYGFSGDFRNKAGGSVTLDKTYIGALLDGGPLDAQNDLLERLEHDARNAASRPSQDPA